MTTIKIIFPWGRYYAHPWGLNPVRLREAEWPPSPWRLLRALASSWFRASPGIAPSRDAVALIQSLGHALPKIGMGKIAFGQTVHYQPNYGASDEKQDARYKNTRHENHFVAVHGPVIFRWPNLSLPQAQVTLLAKMLADLSYFGRAESICQAELVTAEIEETADIGWCIPTSGRRISAHCRDAFCPKADFQITDLWARRADAPKLDSQDAPKHLVDALLATDMKTDGAEWISYEMPGDWPNNRVVRTSRTTHAIHKPMNNGPIIAHYLRFSLQCRVPLPPKFTVPLAEQFRAAAGSYYCKEFGDDQRSFALFGHPEDRPKDAVGDHQHAFYLPTRSFDRNEDNGYCGMITDLHVWCPYGFTRSETQVLMRIQRLTWKDGRYPVRPLLTAMSMTPPSEAPLATGCIKSRIWRSETPFVPPRHFYRGNLSNPKMREQDTPERQLIECLRSSGISDPGEIRRLSLSDLLPEPLESLPPTPQWAIVRAPGEESPTIDKAVISPTHSNGTSGNQQRIGFFMEIRFDKEVSLSMPSFGHSNHFGLGLFLPVADSSSTTSNTPDSKEPEHNSP